jgi:hypothetical protein
MEELKETPEEAGAEVEAGAETSLGKFRLPKRTVIFAAVGLVVLSLFVVGDLAYLSSVREKEAVQAQKRAQMEREAAAKAAAKAESIARGKELHRAHEEVMATDSALPGVFSAPPKAVVPGPVSAKILSAPAVATANPQTPATENKVLKIQPEAKIETKPKEVSTAAGGGAPNAASGCALSGGKAEDYGKALGKCLEEFNRLEGRKPNGPGTSGKTN